MSFATTALAFGVIGPAALAAAQGPGGPSAAPTGVIIGRVVDAGSTMPISGVVVSLSGPALTAGRARNVITDGQGRFAFSQLPKGVFTLTTSVGGNGFSPNGFIVSGFGFPIGRYLPGGLGQRRPNGPLQTLVLNDGDHVSDAVIKLWKPAVISGTVVDDADEPQVGLVVGAVRVTSDGRLLTGPTIRTDDRGAYRFGSLPPGTYLVYVPETQLLIPVTSAATLDNPADPTAESRLASTGATTPRSGVAIGRSRLGVGPTGFVSNSLIPRGAPGAWLWVPTTFAPSATSAARAGRIVVRAAEERTSVMVRVQPVSTVSVSGTLNDATGPVPGFGVHLLPADSGDGSAVLEVAKTSTDASGAFEFPIVPAGQYTISAFRTAPVPSGDRAHPVLAATRISEEPAAWATVPVAVGSSDVTGVTLTMHAGLPLAGHVVFDGSAPQPTPDRLGRLGISLVPARLMFRSDGSPRLDASVDAAGRLAVAGVPPGRYVVRAPDPLPAWTLASVTLGGRDVTDAAFDVEGSELPPLVVTFTDRVVGLGGTVVDGRGSPAPDATVVLFPADRTRWADARVSTRAFREARVLKNGSFALSPLLPGEYLVAAIDGASDDDWPDEAFLAKLASMATVARIAAGQTLTLSLKVAEVR